MCLCLCVCDLTQGISRLDRVPLVLNKLGPSVGKNKVLDALLRIVKDSFVKLLRNIAPVLHAVLDRPRSGALDCLLGIGALALTLWWEGGGEGRLNEGGGHVDLALLAVHDPSGYLKDVLECLELLRRDVDGEIGVADTHELGVDAEGAVETFTDQFLDVVAARGGAIDGLGERALPLSDAGEECDVFTGEVVQSREFQKGSGVALEDVLEGTHGQNTLAGVGGLDGVATGHQGLGHDGGGFDRLGLGAGHLVFELPLRDRVEGFFAERAVADDLVAGEEDGEDFHDIDGKADPLRRQPVLVDLLHGGNVDSDKPHRGSVEVANGASNGLNSPAMGIVDVARLPENDGRDKPGPEELPDHSRPPFPATTHLSLLLHRGTVNAGAGSTPGAVPLAGNDPHQGSKEDLMTVRRDTARKEEIHNRT